MNPTHVKNTPLSSPSPRFAPVLPARRTCTCPPGRHCPNCPARLALARPAGSSGR